MDERVQEREKLAREIHSFIDQVTKEGTQRHESVPLRISLDALHIMLAALRSPGIHEEAEPTIDPDEVWSLVKELVSNRVRQNTHMEAQRFRLERAAATLANATEKKLLDLLSASSIREDATVLTEGSGMLLFDAPSVEDVPVAKTQNTESLEGLSIICNKCGTLVGGEEAGERVRWVTCTICQVATERRERESRASGASRDEGEPTPATCAHKFIDGWIFCPLCGGRLPTPVDVPVATEGLQEAKEILRSFGALRYSEFDSSVRVWLMKYDMGGADGK